MHVFLAACRHGVLALAVLLAACGGGGSSGSNETSYDRSPDSLSFSGVLGEPNPAPQGITVTVQSGTVYLAATRSGAAIADATLAIGSSSAAIVVYPALPATLGPGTHTGMITIYGCNDSNCNSHVRNSPLTTAVTYTVSGISVSQSSVNLTGVEGVNTNAVPIAVSHSGGSTSWTSSINYATGSGWLSVTPGSGSSLPGTINVVGNSMLAGTYNATITLTAGGHTRSIPVTYTVTRALTVTPTSLAFTIDRSSSAAALSQQIVVGTNYGSGPSRVLDWTATPNVSWLAPASGNTSNQNVLTAALAPATLETLANGNHSGTITLSSSVANVSPITIPVSLSFNVPKVDAVAPYVATTGRADQVIIRGAGLTALTAADVLFGSTPADSITSVSASEIKANHPALSAGSYLVRVQNNSGLNRSTGTLVVVDAPNYSATTLAYPNATAKEIAALVYDAERKALLVGVDYPADRSGNELLRYPFTSSWGAATPKSIANLRDAALTVNGTQLLAVSDDAVTHIGAATLATGTVTNAPFSATTYFRNIGVANDGYALLTTSQTGSSSPPIYRYPVSNPAFALYGSNDAPNLATSADASRVVFGKNGSGPQTPLYYNASTGLLYYSTNFTPPVSTWALDRSASRVILKPDPLNSAYPQVRDATFAYLGALPSTTQAAVLNAGGTRAYTYDSSGNLRTFDLTGALVSGIFPEIGSPGTSVANPGTGIKMVLSPDGGTLFMAGDSQVVIVPTP